MSRRNSRSGLKVNASPPAVEEESPETSPARSCVSEEDSLETASMVVVGCPRCLMYVMLAEANPMCPKCKSTVLLDLNMDSAGAGTSRRRRYYGGEGREGAGN